jgi:hypothetical protein
MGKEEKMRYLSEDDLTQVMGLGYLGEVRHGPDGQPYQWVEGIDGLGNPIGFWKALRRFARRKLRPLVRRAMPFVQHLAPFIPGGAAALKVATPILQRAGVAGGNGLGALYEAPDGSLYQVQGLAEDEELRGLGQEEPAQMMGQGYLGEVRQDLQGNLYQWVEGMDGLGNPVGFWKKFRRLAKRALKIHPAALALRAARPLLRRAMPIVQQVAPFVPGGAAVATALKTATPLLRQAGVAGGNGLGALYEAPDGSLYQVQGLAEDEELRGFAEDEELRGLDEEDELRGFAEEEELRGLAEEEELRGFAEEEELRGFAEDEELRGFAEEEELRGLEQGYVRQDEVSGLEAYVPEQPPRTNWFTPAAQAPRKRTLQWDPLW